MKVLLVSLSDRLRAAVAAAPGASGRDLVAAADVDSALKAMNGSDPAVIVVGGAAMSEVMDRCRALKRSGQCGDSVIVASLPGSGSDLQGILEAGADDFFFESLGGDVLQGRLLIAERNAASLAARREIAANREHFFELTLDLLAVAGFDGRFKRVNRAWLTALGWSANEMLATPWLELVHPDDQVETIAAGNRVRAGHELVRFTNRYRHKDGSYRWLEWQSVPRPELEVIYSVARDVTEARQARDALSHLTESLATTLHSIGDGVIATDVNGAVQRMNPVAEALTGWSLSEASNRHVTEIFRIVDATSRQEVLSPVTRALAENAIVVLARNTLLVRRNGDEIPVADSCGPIRVGDGSIAGAVLVFRDLTEERKQAELQAKLQQQLIFSDRMASVGTLAAGVAHEINNPLTYVLANIESALDEVRALSGGSSSGRMRDLEEVLDGAREGATRVAKIVRGLKTFSRVEEQRLGVVDLIPVLELAINMAFNEIRHRARLVKDYGRIPFVEADDARLGQVFINLLVNAAQALPAERTEENEIRILTSTDDQGRAVIEVRDTGPGIPTEIIDRIFDPFFTTKPVGVGTGLGLAICHNIVTDMGGEISVASRVGQGTTFRVVLRASRNSLSVPSKMLRDGTAAPVVSAKVLVIDDEPAVGIAVRRILRGHDVTVVTSGTEALRILTADATFDVILSDLMMPEMSGMHLYATLSQQNPTLASRMVFVTGGAFTPEANAFLDRVGNDRIEKPFDFKHLRETIEKFVK